MSRAIERHIARGLYEEFCRKWRRDKRLAGKAGQPGYRKPTFQQWNAIHLRDQEMMRESTPVDVQEYLGHDPWDTSVTERAANAETDQAMRGVVTIPIVGGDDE